MEPVLLIEGHRLLREALRELLTHSGYDRVAEASDPIEAIALLERGSPNIIIVDTTWEQINGLLLGRLLRQLAPQSKIVLLVDDSWLASEAAQPDSADALVSKNELMKMLPIVLAPWQLTNSRKLADSERIG